MLNETISTIIGFVLFGLSEIMPLINVPANGLLHSLILGVGNAFKSPQQDIELAHSLVTSDKTFAGIINVLSHNPQMKSIVNDLIKNPVNANNLSVLQNDPFVSNLVSLISTNPTSKSLITGLLSDPENITNITVLLANPKLLSSTLLLQSTPDIVDILPTLVQNKNLLNAFKIPDVMNNIYQILIDAFDLFLQSNI